MNIEAKPIRYVALTVEDTGTGMAPGAGKNLRSFLHDKGAGERDRTRLSTAHSIVKNHGGFINVNSEPGKGTSFKV